MFFLFINKQEEFIFKKKSKIFSSWRMLAVIDPILFYLNYFLIFFSLSPLKDENVMNNC